MKGDLKLFHSQYETSCRVLIYKCVYPFPKSLVKPLIWKLDACPLYQSTIASVEHPDGVDAAVGRRQVCHFPSGGKLTRHVNFIDDDNIFFGASGLPFPITFITNHTTLVAINENSCEYRSELSFEFKYGIQWFPILGNKIFNTLVNNAIDDSMGLLHYLGTGELVNTETDLSKYKTKVDYEVSGDVPTKLSCFGM